MAAVGDLCPDGLSPPSPVSPNWINAYFAGGVPGVESAEGAFWQAHVEHLATTVLTRPCAGPSSYGLGLPLCRIVEWPKALMVRGSATSPKWALAAVAGSSNREAAGRGLGLARSLGLPCSDFEMGTWPASEVGRFSATHTGGSELAPSLPESIDIVVRIEVGFWEPRELAEDGRPPFASELS
jgi:hypothetical protein